MFQNIITFKKDHSNSVTEAIRAVERESLCLCKQMSYTGLKMIKALIQIRKTYRHPWLSCSILIAKLKMKSAREKEMWKSRNKIERGGKGKRKRKKRKKGKERRERMEGGRKEEKKEKGSKEGGKEEREGRREQERVGPGGGWLSLYCP